MSKAHSGLDAIELAALDWLQLLSSGDATPEDIAALERWCVLSPQHETAFVAAKQLWHTAGATGHDLFKPDESFPVRLKALRQRARKRTMTRRAALGGGVAALAAASAYGVANPPFGLWPSLTELSADYRTVTGEQRNVTFAGDVAINLNTQTSLAIRSAEGTQDRIELVAGEASFATSARMARSLVVLAGGGQTIAESGRFDVRRITGDERSSVTVTCFEGAVRIERGADVADLRPGQRVRYNHDGLSQIAVINPEIASEWHRGIVEFRAAPLVDAIEEINRYRPGHVFLMSAALGRKPLSGLFRIDQMDDALLALERVFGAKLQHLPGGIVLLS
jgi:transmembrane sensor